jgi:hypothetical protein
MRTTKTSTNRENKKDPYLQWEEQRPLPPNENNKDPCRQRKQQRPLPAMGGTNILTFKMRKTKTPAGRENNKTPTFK